MEKRKYNPKSNTMPNLKYFPEPPGVIVRNSNQLTFDPKETIYEEVRDMVVNVYLNDEKIGLIVIEDTTKPYKIITSKEFTNGDIHVIKYQKSNQLEILYGYCKNINVGFKQ